MRYTYLIDKWVSAGEKTTSGNDFNPQWADVKVDNVRFREAGRREIYNLLCQELGRKNELYKVKLTSENWSDFQNNQHLHGKIDFWDKLISIDEIPGAELSLKK
jgi:hypothetical protein